MLHATISNVVGADPVWVALEPPGGITNPVELVSGRRYDFYCAILNNDIQFMCNGTSGHYVTRDFCSSLAQCSSRIEQSNLQTVQGDGTDDWTHGAPTFRFGLRTPACRGYDNVTFFPMDHPLACFYGNCVADDICQCGTQNHTGATCPFDCFGVSPGSSDVCSFNGTCVDQDTCQCENDLLYTGPNCNVTFCSSHASDSPEVCNYGNGTCVSYETCICSNYSQYSGSECEIPFCDGTPQGPGACDDHGICVAFDTCACSDPLYAGKWCDQPACGGVLADSPSVCGGEGDCTSPGVCECDDTDVWDGPLCEDPVCDGTRAGLAGVCSDRGRCVLPGVCNCDGFWSVSDFCLTCPNEDFNDECTECRDPKRSVTDNCAPRPGLSGGAIAGVVFGIFISLTFAIVVVAIFVVIIVFLVLRARSVEDEPLELASDTDEDVENVIELGVDDPDFAIHDDSDEDENFAGREIRAIRLTSFDADTLIAKSEDDWHQKSKLADVDTPLADTPPKTEPLSTPPREPKSAVTPPSRNPFSDDLVLSNIRIPSRRAKARRRKSLTTGIFRRTDLKLAVLDDRRKSSSSVMSLEEGDTPKTDFVRETPEDDPLELEGEEESEEEGEEEESPTAMRSSSDSDIPFPMAEDSTDDDESSDEIILILDPKRPKPPSLLVVSKPPMSPSSAASSPGTPQSPSSSDED